MKLNFLLIGEGNSDLRLADHIEYLLIEEGFTEVSGEAPELGLFPAAVGRTVREKLTVLLKYYPHTDVVFIHRDCDGAGVAAREREIFDGALDVIHPEMIVPIIPTTMLETWLLADKNAIKRIAGNVSGREDVTCIPSLNRLEAVLDAKQLLLDALCEASRTQGGRLKKFRGRFFEMRARLTTDLDPNGPVRELPSYVNFRRKIKQLARRLLAQA